jgi:DNA-binding NarL/FixJ family response regulator
MESALLKTTDQCRRQAGGNMLGDNSLGADPAVKVWVNDDHPIFRRGLIASLSTNQFNVVGESASLRMTEVAGVDVVVFATTLEALDALDRLDTTIRRVAIVDRADQHLLLQAVKRGVDAVLDRVEMTPDTLVSAIQTVLGGATFLPTGVLSELLSTAGSESGRASEGLTERELAVLRMLAEGDDTREIAGSLCYSERTVKNVVHDLLMKMNCRNRAHAVACATRQGVI